MEYNTQRKHLKIADYGRHVAKMIDYCKQLRDRKERNEMAATIVEVMAHVNPKVKERTDYQQILWDHMMVLADNQLDVDCPYPNVKSASNTFTPHPMRRLEGSIRYRHYGRALEDMIKAVAAMPDSSERTRLTEQIAHTMKRQYLQWNRDTVDDQLIVEQLSELSGGRLSLPADFQFRDSKLYLDAMAAAQAKKEASEAKKKKKKKKKN